MYIKFKLTKKNKKILLLAIVIAIEIIISNLLGINPVKAEEWQPAGWYLSPYQSVKMWRGNHVTSSYTNTKYTTFNTDTSYLWEATAYVFNPVCETDYCVLPNGNYIVTFNISSYKDKFRDDSYIQYYFTNQNNFIAQVQYMNTNNNRIWINCSDTISYYMVQRIDDYNYSISFVFNTPSLPSNDNGGHWLYLYLGYTTISVSSNNDYLVYLDNYGRAGITHLSVVPASDSNLNTHINNYSNYKQQQEIIKQNMITNEKIDDLKTQQNETKNAIDNQTQQQHQDSQDTQNAINDVNDSITDSSTSGAQSDANSFFSSFQSNTFGLSDIITMPLSFINQLTSATCTNLSVPLPFVDTNVELPCMYQIYETHFPTFLSLYQTITFGIVAYWVSINMFKMVKNFKNPENDEVEVMEL